MDDHKGSDFNPNHFTPSQNRNWSPLLVQLRLFEATVCETVRKLIEKVEAIEKGNGKDGNGIVLEGKLELFGDMMKQMDKGISEQLVGIVAAMKSKVVEIDGIVKENRERIIFLEQKVLDENDDYFWNGHDNVDGENNFSLNQNDEEEQNQGLMGECEVMISDPFLLSSSHLSQYDGNPSISFSRWAQKFKDLLSLYTAQLTEEQKISRLRFCLSGPARAELDSMDLPPVTLDGALGHLQSRFENENTKSIARQNLAICRQYPGEKVFDFATRLSEAVRTALAGESESNIRKRLLEEFLDRLIPELQYEVKSERPTDYSRAYELAQHYELLQASRKSTSNVAMNELIEKVEALAMQNVRHAPNFSDQRDHRVCFYCKKAGHVIRDCAARKREANNGPNWRRDENSRRTERNGNYSRPFGQGYERNRETWRNGNSQQNSRPNQNYRRYQDPSGNRREFDQENRFPRPPTPRGNSRGGRIAGARVASPYFLAIIAILALFSPTSILANSPKRQPMICLPDASSSLWKLPEEPICPTWQPTESPIPMELTIYRPNTLQYKTPATACKCVKSKIHRRVGVFGAPLEEVETENLDIPTSTCHRMRDLDHSPAGELSKNGTLRSTNHSLEVGWRVWPVGMFWHMTEVLNCYTYDTVVFTRYGVEGVSTPLNNCPGCQYKSGACRCQQNSMIWSPDPTQQCPFVWVAKWAGEYATKVWISGSNDFALTFENITVRQNCKNKEFAISDQGFSVPLEEYQELVRRRDLASRETVRLRRQLEEITQEATQSREKSPVGLIYSSQLSAQLTALSARLTHTTQRLFSEAIRQICTSLQSIADQRATLAIANPTLLARFFLSNQLITARLVTEKSLEIRPCFGVNVNEMHYNWKPGFCFNRLPVTFMLYGAQRHGFLDTVTLIIYPEAREIDCQSGRWLYIQGEKKLTQYDQLNGDIMEVPWEAIHKIARYGNIDLPEIEFTVFKNKVMANLSELYSPEHFTETLEAAEIHHEIVRLTKPSGAWSENSAKPEFLAGNIVSNGLFSFLKGGIFSANQIWVFCVCCYVTIGAVMRFLLPPFLAELANQLNVGESLVRVTRTLQTTKRRKSELKRVARENDQLQVARQSAIPLTQRWTNCNGAFTNGETQIAEVAVIELGRCDDDSRIGGIINGKKSYIFA
ncbi:hypothetical protein niasHT_013945 [Heterodera trifolii]|uniref:CCHC-type domain-containing protein n=1 Tax=Heterodera trifolii TaxID=157864 RepID=A0ABD2L313_9BILA